MSSCAGSLGAKALPLPTSLFYPPRAACIVAGRPLPSSRHASAFRRLGLRPLGKGFGEIGRERRNLIARNPRPCAEHARKPVAPTFERSAMAGDHVQRVAILAIFQNNRFF